VTAAGLRLNVGCGPDGPQSWTNIDRSPHILLDRIPYIKRALYRLGALGDTHMATWPSGITYGNVCRGLPYPDASAAAIYSSHMLEHLYFDDAQRALREFRRLLSPAGILRLALPDSERLAGDFVANCGAKGADAALEFNLGLNAYPLVRPSGLGRLTSRLGASMHRWQPTGPLVTRMLIDAGFDNVIEQDFLSGDLPDLASVEHRAESFFVEATVAKGTRHT
jgi:SAM-dependent methyltransferase